MASKLSLPAMTQKLSLNHLTKIFERLLRNDIVQQLEQNQTINKNQHGISSNRSIITQLLNYYDDISSKLENGNYVDSVYLNFAKAFNKVDHNILLPKKNNLGI